MTTYVCVKCQKRWKIDNDDKDPMPSGSLCKKCLREALIPTYRKRQLKEGNFDCFGKADKTCDQDGCKYREICLMEEKK
jgi:hypothetical protein